MKLELKKISESEGVVADSVYQAAMSLAERDLIMAASIDPAYADGQLLHEKYETPLEWELNCIVLEGRRGDLSRYAAVLLPYGKRVSTGSVMRQLLDAKKVSFADLSYVVEKTGMEFGSITPLGLPEDWKILIDSRVFEEETVIIGGGKVSAKVVLPSVMLKQLRNVVISDGLTKEQI